MSLRTGLLYHDSNCWRYSGVELYNVGGDQALVSIYQGGNQVIAFDGTPTPAPELGTAALFLAGIGLTFAMRKSLFASLSAA